MIRFIQNIKEYCLRIIRRSSTSQILKGSLRLKGHLFARSIKSDLEINVSDDIVVKERLYSYSEGGGVESFRVAAERNIASDLAKDGSIDHSIEGSSSQGESDSLVACALLISVLNKLGASWINLVDQNVIDDFREEGIDCKAYDGTAVLNIQVTRVETSLFRDLNVYGKVSKRTDVDSIIEEIWKVIVRKAKPIPEIERSQLVLALNAIDSPEFSFPSVISNFHKNYTALTSSLGFKAVWLVGPVEDSVHRLDN